MHSVTNTNVLTVSGLSHSFFQRGQSIDVLANLSFELSRGEIVSVMGESGTGKSTLLLCCGGMLKPTAGKVLISNEDYYSLSQSQRSAIRSMRIGYLFQTLQLIPYLTILQNIVAVESVTLDRAKHWIDRLGLMDRADHKPNALSHGQRQRAALARALAHDPRLLIADEPTGNLDTRTSYEIMEIFQELNDIGKTIVVVTHEPDIAKMCKRNIVFKDGKVIKDFMVEKPVNAKEELAKIPKQEDVLV